MRVLTREHRVIHPAEPVANTDDRGMRSVLVLILCAPSVSDADVGLQANPGVWIGGISSADGDGLALVKAARAELTLRLPFGRMAAYTGPVVDVYVGEDLGGEVFTGDHHGITFGGVLGAHWLLASCWRLGPRLSLAIGEGDGAATGDGTVFTLGAHARNGRAHVGVDLLVVRGDRESGTGFVVGGGFDGRAGKYALATLAAAALVGGVVALVSLGGAQTH